MKFSFLFIGLSLLSTLPAAFPAQIAAQKVVSRDCKPGYDDILGKKKGAPPKRKAAAAEIPLLPSCIEVQDSAISIQEYLQSVVREFRWNIGDEQASEELWSFTLYLGADAAAAFTKPPTDPRIAWTGGKATVNVRTSSLPDGFTRVIVTAKFDGFGEPEDKFAPQRSSWPLPSSGVLESKLTEAARNRSTTGH